MLMFIYERKQNIGLAESPGGRAPFAPQVEELLALSQAAETEPASARDFQEVQQQFSSLVSAYPDTRASYGGKVGVVTSVPLRRLGAPEDAPPFRVMTDPYGQLSTGRSSVAGKPSISLLFERQRADKQPWTMQVELFQRDDGLVASVSGGRDTGRHSHENLPIQPMTFVPVSKDMLSWISSQAGRPEEVAAVPTRRRQVVASVLGFLSFKKP